MTGRGAGSLALQAALGLSAAASVLSAVGSVRWGRRALVGAAAGLTVALGALAAALLRGDWSLTYVADYSSRTTPWPYRLAGLWAGMAGSLLLWAWVLGVWAVAASVWCRRRLPAGAGVVQAILSALLAVVAGLLVWATPPFARLALPAIDGSGLTPVLRHPAMLYHPLLLYAGQVGLAVPFALAMAGSPASVRAARRWMIPPLMLLGGAMIAGAHWAYVELGWGGYWAWDPVENAALLPWLAGLACLHVGGRWAARLTGATFGLALAGAYLTRSGATGSVHAFAEAGTVGRVFAALLLAIVVGTVAAELVRKMRRGDTIPAPESGARALGAIALGALAVLIAIGTFLPLFGDGLVVTGRYFSTVAWPFVLVLLVGAGLAVRLPLTARRLAPALAAVPALAVAWWWLDRPTPLALATAGAGAAAVALTLAELRVRRTGGLLAHLGAAVLLVAVVATATGVHREGVLGPGQPLTVRGYALRLEAIKPIDGDGPGAAVEAVIGVFVGDGRRVATLRPKALVGPAGQRVAVAGVRSTPLEDVSVTLRAIGPDGTSATVVVAVTPLAAEVWWGGLLVLAGLGLCLVPLRRVDLAPLLAEEAVDGGRGGGGLGDGGAPAVAAASGGARGAGRRSA